jgi:enoyl-CoA hydratase/carnithine racemase
MSNTVLKSLDAGVLTLTLNRPEKKNAFNLEQWAALQDAFNEADADDSTKVVLLTGSGDNFSSGVDLNDLMHMSGFGPDHPFLSCARKIAFFTKPLVAAAAGVAVGGGATMLLHCDLVYISESFRMRFPFANLGLAPEFASSYMLQLIVGAQRAAELMYTAEWVDARRAIDLRFAAGCYTGETVIEKAMDKAKEIAQWPLSSLREIKHTLKAHQKQSIESAFALEAESMAKLAQSPESIEAVIAFLEKRAPGWR